MSNSLHLGRLSLPPAARAALLFLVPIAVGTILVAVLGGLGALSLPGLATLAFLIPAITILAVYGAPQLFILLPALLIPLPALWVFFPFEIALLVVLAIVLLIGAQRNAPWLRRLQPLEAVLLGLTAWAMFTGFWCEDVVTYATGVWRLTIGLAALWTTYRLARLARRSLFEWSLVLMTFSLVIAAGMHRIRLGITEEQALQQRAAATDLGWGTANFIAALLLVLTPLVLQIALHTRQRVLRILAWLAVPLVTALLGTIASRAALVLFIGGVAVLVAPQFRRLGRALWPATALLALLAAILSTYGAGVAQRFTSMREAGSMVIRIWYFREAWRRTVEYFPWGMGINQGLTRADHLYGIDPHNYWLAVSSELGIPGLVAWVVALVLILRLLSRMANDPQWRGEAHALRVSFWLSQLHTLVEPTFQGVHFQFVFFWIFGGYLGYSAVTGFSSAGAVKSPGAQPASTSSER